ncbi:MAG: DUF58 domain-containing protein [Myxococcota bacterium]
MIPTGRLVALAVVPMALGLMVLAMPWLTWPMVALDVVIVAVAAFDALLNRGKIIVERHFTSVQAVGRPFDVTVRISGNRSLACRVTDDAPGEREGLPGRVRLQKGHAVDLTYQLQVNTRGEHPFGAVYVRWASPLGLFERQVMVDVPGLVRVYPSFRQLRSWGLLAREDERRAPVRVKRRPGGENEFERLRPYVRGDSYRHIDWKATARRASLVTRDFGQESNQNVIFLIDAGRMMSSQGASMTAFDHALNAAVMMGQVALRHGDRVGMLVYDDQIRTWLPPKGGARAGSRLIRGTYDLFPSLREPDHAQALRWLAQHVRRRSLVVMLTSVVDDVNAATTQAIVGAMVGRHLPLVVWLRDEGLESLIDGPRSGAPDHYAAGAAAELLVRREAQLQALRQRGALVIDSSPEDVTPRLLSRYLEVKARQIL